MTAPSAVPLTGILIDSTRSLTFTFEDRPVTALAGQSIAAALYAAGVRVFSRSFKYHRPRGLFCVSGDCPSCLMQVDGCPNVRTCIEPAREGQVVRRQNAWPSADFDVLRIFDRFDRFLPVGFYYKHFHRPRWLWPIFEHTVRHIAGLGRIDLDAGPFPTAVVEHLHTDICVIGGGPAGLAAAAAALAAGARVLLLERGPQLGGHLLYDGGRPGEIEPLRAVLESPRAQVLCGTTAFGLYEGNLVGAFREGGLLKVRARHVIVCTGSRQQPFLFPRNDLPGIMLGNGVLRLAHLHGVRAGRRAVVLTDNDGGARLAGQLADLGIEIAAVIDQRVEGPCTGDWPTFTSSTVLEARGNKRLRAVRLARRDANSQIIPTTEQEIACDLLCLVSEPAPANELLLQAGMRFRPQGGRWLPDGTVPGLSAAGGAAGTLGLDAQVQEGRLRGAEAAAVLGYAVGFDFRSALADFQLRNAPAPAGAVLGNHLASLANRKSFVCLCEDVTVKDLEQAIAEGFDHIETLKRYSTVSMGPCQGKMCSLAASAVCARVTGRDPAIVGTTTSRPPAVPVDLGVLAAGRRHHPVRRTPLHHWHQAAGARWLDAGWWKRPESYGDPESEVRAVRQAVGLIDVSTLGKIELVGPDAAELLERVYLNRWADLQPGRIRYGVMCTEEGILFDDGVGARLGPDRFYLTATTGNADAVFQWLELWRDTWRLDVVLLNQTAGTAAMNLAGPKSREVLARLTRLDVSAAAFPYLALREGEVAGVPCRLLRLGFVGELGYEIHCPAAYAWHLWEALVQAGAAFGLRPFGVEAQRVLRLEKGHLIIGVDTDSLSNPLDAGLEGLVRFDKPLFHGREPLLRLKAMGPRCRLVGFRIDAPVAIPAELEGCQVVEQGRPVGRLTSVRFSPTLGGCIGLAWVPAAESRPGTRFHFHWAGREVPARVVPTPFYDPEGKRLKC